MRFSRLLTLIFLINCLQGCSVAGWFSSDEESGSKATDSNSQGLSSDGQEEPPSTDTGEREASVGAAPTVGAGDEYVEITWKVSDRKITAYHIHYGSTESDLSHHIRIPVSEIETINHPISGKAYRVRIKSIEPGAAVFVALQAENEFGTSARSAPMRVEVTK